jgi:elongation factor P (EF-P) rhamnosyltransferase EarP-like protein
MHVGHGAYCGRCAAPERQRQRKTLRLGACTIPRKDIRMRWDIFCKVIDNHGDIGVCWRLCASLAARGEQVRLWVDDGSALRWMAPAGHPGVEVRAWTMPFDVRGVLPGDVLVEAFGCEIAPEFIAACAHQISASNQNLPQPVWINLEYLSAEPYAERCHRLPSPVAHGPAAGWTKWFFYPGFTPGTGGVLREPDLTERQARFDRARWLRDRGAGAEKAACHASLFCYEPAGLPELLAGGNRPERISSSRPDAPRRLCESWPIPRRTPTPRPPIWATKPCRQPACGMHCRFHTFRGARNSNSTNCSGPAI